MRITQTTVVAISLFLLGAVAVWAADNTPQAAGAGGAPKTDPSAATTTPAAATTPATGTTPAAAGQGAAAPLKDAVVGTWKSVDDAEEMEFNADGSARIKEPNAMFVATYKILDGGRLKLDVPVFKNQKDLTYKVEIKGDQMTMTLGEQKARAYSRVK